MSLPLVANQDSIQQDASNKMDRRHRAASSEFHEAKRRRATFRPLFVWPLVVLSLIQVTPNLFSQDNDKTPQQMSSLLHPPNKHSLSRQQACQAGATVCCLSAKKQSLENYAQPMQNTFDVNLKQHSKHLQETAHPAYEIDLCSSPSSKQQISSLSSLLSSSPPALTYLISYINALANNLCTALSQIVTSSYFGPRILLAEAALVTSNSMYQANYDKEIIALNSTNFNAELIQFNHPFPHIKLIEYYLAYCGICLKFKPTYVQLSKEIHPWRNVIRPSAIDLGVSSNTPIASSWSIDVIPTLRIHPPPSPLLATQLNKQMSALSSKSSKSDILKSMSEDYNAANLTIGSLGVIKYTYDAKKESLADKVTLLKLDLIRYIERYVDKHPDELPSTWPNLRPVKEKALAELRRNHPRQELFLVVEAGSNTETDQSSTLSQPSLGLQMMLELSSSAALKAIRYVRASENRALIEDVIAHKMKESSEQLEGQNNNDQNTLPNEQVELLHKLLESKQANKQDHLVLIHIDDSHSPSGRQSNTPATKFPSVTVVTGADLIIAEQQYANLDSNNNSDGRLRRAIISHRASQRSRRALFHNDEEANKMSLQRKLELLVHYINQTYVEVQEDKEFLKALSSFDENPTAHNLKRDAVQRYQAIQQANHQIALSQDQSKPKQQQQLVEAGEVSNSTFKQFLSRLDPTSGNSFLSPASRLHQNEQEDDYQDKLMAIRYIFFREVPRKTLANKSPAEKIEKLNALINLASVIKAYFPLPDLASVQFIDAIHNYLTKQQTILTTTLGDQNDQTSPGAGGFDFRALKQVIKNLEVEGKRLPEVADWKHCKFSGYPCALWRLFHTLTAFEYKKLSQISQQSQQSAARQVSMKQQQPNLTLAPSPIAETQTSSSELKKQLQQQQTIDAKPLPAASENNNGPQSPVERVVSPPSTTTSLSLTIATPITAHDHKLASVDNHSYNNHNGKQISEADLPEPVLLVMRDYITNFFSCEECARNFRQESIDLSFEKIRRQEPAEFSILWLWETHNRISKRLSVNSETNPSEHPKKWFPSFEQCPKCYNKPPSYLKDTNVELPAIFHESIDWNRGEVLSFLVDEFSRQPMDMGSNLFGYSVPNGFNYIIVIGISSLILIVLLRCASCYIERQRRHKASLLNGNGAHYSVELQAR